MTFAGLYILYKICFAGGIPSGKDTEEKLNEINNRLINIEKKLRIKNKR